MNNNNLDQILNWVLQDNEVDQSLNTLNNGQVNATEISQKSSNSTSEDDELTDAQLKLLPSKERRQIRNKISARNFRNRRKEYLASLEAKIERYEIENNQLKFEVKWVRDMMSRLQSENDRLRLELVLCKGGVNQPGVQQTLTNIPSAATIPTPPIEMFTSQPRLLPQAQIQAQPGINWVFDQTAMLPHVNNSIMSSQLPPSRISHPSLNFPLVSSNTDAGFRSASSTSSDDVSDQSTHDNNNIFIAHASVPNWDLSNLLRGKSDNGMLPAAELIRTYPLLAPALMSIVIQHTMTLRPLLPYHTDPIIQALPHREEDKFVASLSDTILWENILVEKPLIKKKAEEDEKNAMLAYIQEHCPLIWIQKQFCKFILLYVIVKYPKLNKPCRTWLPICEKFRIRD